MFNVKVDGKFLKTIFSKLRRVVFRTFELTAIDISGNIEENAPQDHGRLAGSFVLIKKNPRHFEIFTDVEYADVQDQGRPHYIIKPKEKKALRFVYKGDIVFAKKVKHPGLKGKHYVQKSIDRATANDRLLNFIHQAMSEEGLQ